MLVHRFPDVGMLVTARLRHDLRLCSAMLQVQVRAEKRRSIGAQGLQDHQTFSNGNHDCLLRCAGTACVVVVQHALLGSLEEPLTHASTNHDTGRSYQRNVHFT